MARWWKWPRDYPHPDDVRMTLGEHLEELRSRMIRALVGLAVGAAICFGLIEYIMAFLTSMMYATLRAQGQEAVMIQIHPAEQFMIELKVALIIGLMISAPYSLTQIWGFVAAGLYPKERRWVNRFAPVSIALFFVGALFFVVVASPLLLSFLISYRTSYPDLSRYLPSFLVPYANVRAIASPNEPGGYWPTTQQVASFDHDPKDPLQGVPWLNRTQRELRIHYGANTYTLSHLQEVVEGNVIKPEIRIGEFIPFMLQLAAAFGIGFQVPVVVAFLAATGIAQTKDMARLRRHVYFVMAIVAAVVTPPDPGSMLMLLGPMIGLFEIGLFAGRGIERKRQEAARHAS